MKGIRIVIVDDSMFSIAVIKNILEEHGFEVVGQAGSLEEVKAVISETKPDLVTMDMTLPGTDGLECTRAIHEIDPNIKVIVISSMMDDEIVKEAKASKVSAYIQKPVDADELVTTIHRILASVELYQDLTNAYPLIFKEALLDAVNKMTKTLLTYKKESVPDEEFKSRGLTVIIGMSGKFSGSLLIDLSKETAVQFVGAMMKAEPKNNDQVTAALGEFTNILAGNACSLLNKLNKAYGLRVTPPSVLQGDGVVIARPNFKTTSVLADTKFGEILLNVGFARGEHTWM